MGEEMKPKKAKKINATWDISLNCNCPECDKYVDLVDLPDFWNFHDCINAGESGTRFSRDVGVICPECNAYFKADFLYRHGVKK